MTSDKTENVGSFEWDAAARTINYAGNSGADFVGDLFRDRSLVAAIRPARPWLSSAPLELGTSPAADNPIRRAIDHNAWAPKGTQPPQTFSPSKGKD
ncbi:hypothetical protein [Bradyrhizobium elkanii]|uniref:hypothetical protein n=1 Tax=Bradyrhizobium elkanii TaxID=29448 RepID=UPI00209C883F|nr:hypothetical protein [Bradyrhizobium elkanii]MCP1968501.1 hypothetical protein [Bradyrhizobium elkanii]MCS4109998.1 hypothetical protein [Bradyrhizobium elkanii]